MAFTEDKKQWYIKHINKLDAENKVVKIDTANNKITYISEISSDENSQRDGTYEEFVRALSLCLLTSNKYRYEAKYFYIERYYSIGRPSLSRAEIDLIIYEQNNAGEEENQERVAFSVWEFKSPDDYYDRQDYYIQHQLYDPSPLIGAPKYLVYATILPEGDEPRFTLINIDYAEYFTFEKWISNERQSYDSFPPDYEDENIVPIIKGSEKDLNTNITHQEFRTLAKSFHQEFWAEKQDTDLFKDILKLFLAKIYDERITKNNEIYKFQILHSGRKEETNKELFERISQRYIEAYIRYIEPDINPEQVPELSPKEFSPEKVKYVVRKLQRFSITKNTANQGDIVGSFFEEILRDGFKQDKGMYFTHSNLVNFMVEAIDLKGLAISIFKNANHHNNRMPYIIDPACGSGTFLIVAMNVITKSILDNREELVSDDDSEEFVSHQIANDKPNHWAKDFIYGLDPKFIMALTAKVNMVLHGDGSAHVYKNDGLTSLSAYNDIRLNEQPAASSSISDVIYNKPVCERFDVILTNPPFGVTIEESVKSRIPDNFTLSPQSSSEALFFERWFQLLKPNGRVAAVLPESFFNTSENIDARLLMYRFFKIKAIVSLPQNMFVDTPTLTSLLFAQKKTKSEITAWDKEWNKHSKVAEDMINKVRMLLKNTKNCDNLNDLKENVLDIISTVIDTNSYIVKKGKEPLRLNPTFNFESLQDLKQYYREIMNLSGFKQLILIYIFNKVASKLNYSFRTYCVDEVGYKLSKRNEKQRPNQLCTFVSNTSGEQIVNLHLTDESIKTSVDTNNPKNVLDLIRRDVKWD